MCQTGPIYFFDRYDRAKVEPEEVRLRNVQVEMAISQTLDGINFNVTGEITGHRGHEAMRVIELFSKGNPAYFYLPEALPSINKQYSASDDWRHRAESYCQECCRYCRRDPSRLQGSFLG